MIKQFLIVFTLITTAIAVHSQEGTTSSYSFYGVGLQKFKGTASARFMGGIRTYKDAYNLNLQNPATYADLTLTTFALGASRSEVTLKNETADDHTAATSLEYLAVGIPAGKFGFAFGLIPFTAVGYNVISTTATGESRFSGTGGMNRVFLGFGYQLAKGLNVGIEGSYNFGIIEDKLLTFRQDVQFGSRDVRRAELSSVSYSIGAVYTTKLTNDLDITSSLTLSPNATLSTKTTRELAPLSGFDTNGSDNFNPQDVQSIQLRDQELNLPTEFTVGFGLGKANKWYLATEISSKQENNSGSRYTTSENIRYRNAFGSRLGGYYIPNYNSLTSYWKRITYRAGMRVEELGLEINGESIREFGMSFGIGLPIPRLYSTINIGAEIGRRGTTNTGLVQENFVNLFLGLTLNDRWFIKRKYD